MTLGLTLCGADRHISRRDGVRRYNYRRDARPRRQRRDSSTLHQVHTDAAFCRRRGQGLIAHRRHAGREGSAGYLLPVAHKERVVIRSNVETRWRYRQAAGN
jgi:hypothetical protein